MIQQFRNLSTETPYPVNFLLFDYKGEFSDPANASWLNFFDVDRTCILDPVQKPLPFTPFKDFSGKDFQEIKSEIAGLQKGELIIKDNTMAALGLGGKTYKKIKVTHLI